MQPWKLQDLMILTTQRLFFEVTLPEEQWSKSKTDEYMAGFNQSTIVTTAAHEAFPGHYNQFLWQRLLSSKVRRLVGADSNSEGWAHYCEQLIVDAGYDNNNPQLRLGQLQDALLRDARYIVSIEMHTGHMRYQQAIQFFIKEAYFNANQCGN